MQNIQAQLQNSQNYLKQNYGVSRLGIFGSYARGEETKDSDIDILVEFSNPIGLFRFVELEEYLSKTLGKKVDLVTKNAIKPTIKDEVLSQTLYV